MCFQHLFPHLQLHWVLTAVHGLSLSAMASPLAEHRLCSTGSAVGCTGSAAPQNLGSSRTSDRTHIHCTGRQILNHQTTREACIFVFKKVTEFCIYNVCAFLYVYYTSTKHLIKKNRNVNTEVNQKPEHLKDEDGMVPTLPGEQQLNPMLRSQTRVK